MFGDHWHAVQRDLLALGFRAKDIGTDLSLDEFASIVLAPPANSSVFLAVGGWTKEAHLIATQMEQSEGLIEVQRRVPRPGVPEEPPIQKRNPRRVDSFDAMTLEEFERLRAENYARTPPTQGRVIGPEKRGDP